MTHHFHPSILREYDIRSPVGPLLGPADAHAVGRSFATRVRRVGGSRVAVGRDGRLSSPELEAALVAGLVAGGVDVVRIGLGPTPMLSFAEATLGVDGGIQVTASHNPAGHNGFKLMLGHRSFFGDDVQDLARLAAAGDWTEGAGTVADIDILDIYVARLLDARPAAARVGWDTGNGAAGPVIEALTARLPGEHHLLHTAVDGRFPNHHPDPSVEENLADLKALVLREGLDCGFAFDGDGDRIGAVDGLGRAVRADLLLALLAEPVLRDLPGSTIIADVKSSAALFDRVRELGGRPLMWKSGYSSIKSRMLQDDAPIAGELSGHIFFAHRWYGFDDAQYAAVRLLELLADTGRTLADLVDALPRYHASPELRFPVDPARRLAVVDEVLARLTARGATVDPVDGARVTTPDGWWLLRASNTESLLTIRAEARDEAGLARLLAEIDAELAASRVARPAD
ncbi:phosphoglucomutase/phosphomannomutase PgmG [uncultured Sphingomonas sp.]|uniref:phosphoglucomutase/phosphomannomutase PgmG n=1 Tax=uncultured Sphingomonas sp. TaxID=158754 RepID=UPI0035CB9DFE